MLKATGSNFDLRSFRKSQKLSQSDLAGLFGVGRTTFGEWENQKAPSWIELACRGLRASLIFPSIRSPMTAADLIFARTQMGLRQDGLAQEFGVSRSTVSRMENGEPHLWVSYALAALAITKQDF